MLRDEKFAEIVFALPTHLVAISERFAPAAAEIIANPEEMCFDLPASKALLEWLEQQAEQYPDGTEGAEGFSDAHWRAEQAFCSDECTVRERLECLLTSKNVAVLAQLLHAAEEKEAGHPLVAETTPTETAEENNGN